MHGCIPFQLPFRDSFRNPSFPSSSVAFNSLFGILPLSTISSWAGMRSFNSLFGILRTYGVIELPNEIPLSTPFSGFLRSSGSIWKPTASFFQLPFRDSSLLLQACYSPSSSFQLPFRDSFADHPDKLVEFHIFQLPFRDSSHPGPSTPRREEAFQLPFRDSSDKGPMMATASFNSLFGIRR